MSPIREALDHETNSPHQHLRECIGNSMENMHSDVRVKMVNKDFVSCSRHWDELSWMGYWAQVKM